MVIRTQIPQNLTLNSGSLFEDFEDLSTWGEAVGGTKEADAVNYKSGTQGVKLTVSTAGGNVRIDKTISRVFSEDDFPIDFWIYVPTRADVSGISLYFTSSNYSKFFTAGVVAADLIAGWNHIRFNKTSFTNNSGESWDNTMTKMRVTLFANTGKTPNVTVDKITLGIKNIPKIIFTLDDGFASVVSKAFPYMQARGIRGTCFVCSNLVESSDANYMRKSSLDVLYADEWDISNHTSDHTNLTTLTTDVEISQKITDCRDKLIEWGYERSYNLFAYPNGAYNDQVLSVLDDLDILVARSGLGGNQYFPIEDMRLLHTRGLGLGSTFIAEKLYIDRAIRDGGTLIYYLHNIADSPSTANDIATAEFEKIIQYIYERGIDCPTLSEWVNYLTNPRKQTSRT